jgi:hypothetical protein
VVLRGTLVRVTDTQMTGGPSPHADLHWHKSSSCPSNATCVEVAALPDGGFAMRDGKNPDNPALRFDAAAWRAFLTEVRAGAFDPSTGPDRARP